METNLLRDRVGKLIFDALLQVCGGGISFCNVKTVEEIMNSQTSFDDKNEQEEESSSSHPSCNLISRSRNENISDDSCGQRQESLWFKELQDLAYASVSFPNNNTNSVEGKPHDVEVRAALALFHKYNRNKSKANKKKKSRQKRKRINNNDPSGNSSSSIMSKSEGDSFCSQHQQQSLQVISDMGLTRIIRSPLELAECLCHVVEESCREQHQHQAASLIERAEEDVSTSCLSHDIRSNASGIICIITPQRASTLRQLGRLPCPQCVKWCKGEKGLWWHQQQEHGSEHSVAAASAANERQILAIVPYNPAIIYKNNESTSLIKRQTAPESSAHTAKIQSNDNNGTKPKAATPKQQQQYLKDENSVLEEVVKAGNVQRLLDLVKGKGSWYDPTSKEALDRNGASPLHWASGLGLLDMVQCLVMECGCSPEEGQNGKRSFAGRTPLHWAARNGHLNVVKYLVKDCKVDLNATTADGTTAFCWACWQGHLPVMSFLHDSGCDIHKSNSFGCNAVLWCAQGGGDVDTMKWLQSIGCETTLVNSNGHGALHKAAQRGRVRVCEWFCASSAFKDACLVTSHSKNSDTLLLSNINGPLQLIAPDSDGCCPSDLAGMAGHEELALWIAQQEISVSRRFCTYAMKKYKQNHSIPQLLVPSGDTSGIFPKWISNGENILNNNPVGGDLLNLWEPNGGRRRIGSSLRRLFHDGVSFVEHHDGNIY
mmetsp:Transcript_23636/g.33168  ORF Transcript_23636/g.33168 Transcript_23636/m.33168 type:complete len:714 (+) Transcript_23636:182-2323(+)